MGLLDIAILYMSCIIDLYFFYMFHEAIFEKRDFIHIHKGYFFVCNFIFISLMLVVNILGNVEINLFIITLLMWIYVHLVFDGKISRKIISFVVMFFIIWGTEWVFAVIFNLGSESYKKISQMPFTFFALKLLTYIIIIIVRQLLGKNEKRMDNRIFLTYLFLPIASFGLMEVIFYADIDFWRDTNLIIFVTLCYVLLLVANISIFYVFNKYSEEMYSNMEKQVLLTKQKADLNYYMQLYERNENYNEFLHDTVHYLRVINQLAKEKDYEGIREIVDKLNVQLEKGELIAYSNHHILNAILSDKKQQAEDLNVEFDAYVEPGINLYMVSDADLIAMLGNLLDNALRGAAECKDRSGFVRVRVYMQDIDGFCVIKIVNSFSGKLVRKDDLFVSTKEEKGLHGLGISSATKMAEKYGGSLFCNPKEDCFEAILSLSVNHI